MEPFCDADRRVDQALNSGISRYRWRSSGTPSLTVIRELEGDEIIDVAWERVKPQREQFLYG
jgi:hypothetical protein